MAVLRTDDFASALTGANAFSSASTAGDMTWNSGTGPDSSSGYVNLVIDDTTADYGLSDFTALGATPTDFQYMFYVDLDDLAISTADESVMISSFRTGTGPIVDLRIVNVSGALKLRHTISADSSGPTSATEDIALTSVPLRIGVWVHKATNGSGANDGYSKLYFRGGDYSDTWTSVSELTGVDLFDNFELGITIRTGATNIGASVSATAMKFDAIYANSDTNLLVFNAAPTITVPAATQYSAIGVAYDIGSLISGADTDGNVDELRLRCTEALGDIGVTLSGGVTVTAGNNNSHDMTLGGTQAALLTVLATATYTATAAGSATITVDITDDAAATDQDTFTVRSAKMVVIGSTQPILNGAANTFTVTNAVEEDVNLTVTGIDDAGLEGSAGSVLTFAGGTGSVAGNAGVSHAKLSHTIGLHF